MPSNLIPAEKWSLLKRAGLLILTVYLFFLFADFTSSDEIFPAFIYKLVEPYVNFWSWLVPWTGKHILHLPYDITVTPNGSGDTTYNYVLQFLWMVLALLTGLTWALLDRKRPGYNRLYYWVRIFTRYYFAYILFMYGSVKIIKLQFPFPSLFRLTEPYGHSSPMGLAWTFIGYSKMYNFFTGGAEVLAGCLLFFKRTTLLGSLMAMTIMINVFVINMAYDIPVKIFSANLVFLAVFLAAHDWDRLKDFFFRNAPAAPSPAAIPVKRKRTVIIQRSLKALFILSALYFTFWSALGNRRLYGEAAPKSPFYGIYAIQTFEKQGVALPPLTTDTVRWKQVIFDDPNYAHITTMADSAWWVKLRLDSARSSLVLVQLKAPADSFLLHVTRPDKNHLLLSGLQGRDSVRISMTRMDLNKFKLVSRGFHWINEYPYNR